MWCVLSKLSKRNSLFQQYKLYKKCEHNLRNSLVRSICRSSTQNAKLFLDRENMHAYKVIEHKSAYGQVNLQDLFLRTGTTEINSELEMNVMLSQDWRIQTATDIVRAFRIALPVCIENNINLSDTRFNNLTDGLLDNVEKITDEELIEMLDLLALYPETESFKSHNYHDIWSALDDVCCWRLSSWDKENVFPIADRWYKLNLGKLCDFIYEVLEKLSRKPTKLSKDQLVHLFFYMNICRKRIIDFEYETALDMKIDKMSLDEMGIAALGYFKTQSKVKIARILSVMMEKAIAEPNPDDLTLCAILKIVRFTSNPSLADQMTDFIEKVSPKLEKSSNLCQLHGALFGTTLQIEHRPAIFFAANRIAKNLQHLEKVRLKDMERILLPLSMFDYNPNTEPDIFKAILEELQHERRFPELDKYPRCLSSALHFLSVKNIYSEELLNKVLNMKFVTETYGRSSRLLPMEIFSLDISTEIDLPDYNGYRMDPSMRYKASKWLTRYSPSYTQTKRISASEKVILDVTDRIMEIVGAQNILIDHVLPHFPRADIICCRDKKTGKFVEPFGLQKYQFGDIKKPTDGESYEWFAVVVAGWNNTIRDTNKLVGQTTMKLRHLERIGYKAVPVIWNEYQPLTLENKLKHIENKLRTWLLARFLQIARIPFLLPYTRTRLLLHTFLRFLPVIVSLFALVTAPVLRGSVQQTPRY
ncbi:PREDICTED: FAST kinase domain-containing protein 5, mitochondrial [Nicrophorus vespilloides]|uniref:FAST kinase domain-containing protein 5, mitochondrial n=1 Tax=Nicrophorus vespilloides TaxID=110193 RepID=A0ABM1MIQ2_NICVS|nr:PREDICTED: FAST kinase domain-containing protein 5, mitochondrial [Nicrophorus vespilloides]